MPGWELFGDDERKAVNDLFDANGGVLFAHGFDAVRNGVFKVREYEGVFAEKLGFPFAQAVSSGSAALAVALQAAGVRPGDEVITQAHTFVATVEAITLIGAIPVVVDIDETLNMDPEALQSAVTAQTTAIVPVHMLGEMCDMNAICRVADRFSLLVVEDCAQGLGSSLHGQGAGTFGVTAAFSTDAGKTISTGEGGVVACSDASTFELARARHDHGHGYVPGVPRGLDPALSGGFNFRMTELQAAIGIVQLARLDQILCTQRSNKARLMEAFSALPVQFRTSIDPSGDSGDTVIMLLPDAETALRVVGELSARAVGTKNLPDAMRWHFAGFWMHLLPQAFTGASHGWQASASILGRSVSLGVSASMSEDQVDRLAERIIEAVSVAT